MARPDALHELELLLRSGHGLIHLRTDEEERATRLLRHVAASLDIPFFTWSRSRGLVREGIETGGVAYDTKELAKALAFVAASSVPSLYQLLGVGSAALADDLTASLLHDAAKSLEG